MRVFVTGGSGFVGRRLISALKARGDEVRALARSDKSVETVRAMGAEPVSGDLDDAEALRRGMEGCDGVVHAAAHVKAWGSSEEFFRINVEGTQRVIDAARAAKVKVLVHVGTEAMFVGGKPIVQADETWTRPEKPLGLYPLTKGLADERVLAANGQDGLRTVVVRPRFIWGKGDLTLLPEMIEKVRTGQFRWIGGGRYLTSTCHVANVVEGILLAMDKGRGGQAYFLTDGSPVEFRAFVSQMMETAGVKAPQGELPYGVAKLVASVAETAWRVLPLKGEPPLHRSILRLIGEEVTVNDAKARAELGYVGHMTREAGFAEMRS
ncbi:MAG TPA: NAD-dependent epimerase/dehydratase family protein [Archangium sp.]|jgi:nucleoside-diphosphate-sugar epimerase|uniref:NAD-dependent epimerase/dehydratase family protein n=1 Tax=Archangium sp. TaxID=1872627 RepID=UPI002ED95898